jgi:apolipoprotein N-acyltransferase
MPAAMQAQAWRWMAAVTAGLAHAASFAPLNAWWLQLMALAVLVLLLHGAATWRAGLALGAAFGLGWFGLGVYWVFISMHTYGGMPAPIAVAATLALAALLASFGALGCALFAGWKARRGLAGWRMAAAFAACWGACEWLRGWAFSGFPWIASGYAHTDGPLRGWAPVTGVFGLCAIAAFVSAALALAVQRRRPVAALLPAGLLVLGGWGLARGLPWTVPAGQPIAVRLLQGNVPQPVKFVRENLGLSLDTYLELTLAKPADLVVLPETAVPTLLDATPPEFLDGLQRFATHSGSTILAGIPLHERRQGPDGPRNAYFNSALAITPDAQPLGALRYSKHHLVPFGEFIPPFAQWFVDLMHIPLGDFDRGGLPQPPLPLAGQRIAVNICYEDLFGEEIAKGLRRPEPATILVNLTNLGWFGDSLALPQHLQISRMRALETGRPVLRATNTGATAVIGPTGRVEATLPTFTRGALEATVQGRSGTTPYIRFGNSAALALIALCAAAGAFTASPLARARKA